MSITIEKINKSYGKQQALADVSFSLKKGEVVGFLGPNGAGKSTLMKIITCFLQQDSGKIQICHLNTLEENLKIASNKNHKDDWSIEKVLEIFPALKSKYYNSSLNLSGGEQQMLAIARALLLIPKLILLDEPSQGLAPKIVLQIEEILHKLLKKNISILLVEQNLKLALALATNISIIGKGLSRWEGKKLNFTKNVNKYKEWISV